MSYSMTSKRFLKIKNLMVAEKIFETFSMQNLLRSLPQRDQKPPGGI